MVVEIDPVVDRRHPIGVRDRLALRVADRHQRHVGELLMEWDKLRQIETAMQRGDDRRAMGPCQREAEEIEMAVNDVELLDLPREFTECDGPEGREVLVARAMVPERLVDDRVKPGGGAGVAAGE